MIQKVTADASSSFPSGVLSTPATSMDYRRGLEDAVWLFHNPEVLAQLALRDDIETPKISSNETNRELNGAR